MTAWKGHIRLSCFVLILSPLQWCQLATKCISAGYILIAWTGSGAVDRLSCAVLWIHRAWMKTGTRKVWNVAQADVAEIGLESWVEAGFCRNVPGERKYADLLSTKAKSRMSWDAADMQRAAWFRQLKIGISRAWNRFRALISDILKEGELQTNRRVA